MERGQICMETKTWNRDGFAGFIVLGLLALAVALMTTELLRRDIVFYGLSILWVQTVVTVLLFLVFFSSVLLIGIFSLPAFRSKRKRLAIPFGILTVLLGFFLILILLSVFSDPSSMSLIPVLALTTLVVTMIAFFVYYRANIRTRVPAIALILHAGCFATLIAVYIVDRISYGVPSSVCGASLLGDLPSILSYALGISALFVLLFFIKPNPLPDQADTVTDKPAETVPAQ